MQGQTRTTRMTEEELGRIERPENFPDRFTDGDW